MLKKNGLRGTNEYVENEHRKHEVALIVNRQTIVAEDERYRKYMCKNCVNFNGNCKKNRKASICAEKGLKNR